MNRQAPPEAFFKAFGTEIPEDLVAAATLDRGAISHDGLARIFAERYAGVLRYCHSTGAWFQWTGTHWRRDEIDLAFQYARRLGRELSEDGGKADMKEARKVGFAGGVERFARGDPALAVTAEAWDCDPFLLGTPNGTVDLRTGELRAADQAEGVTKLTAVAPADKVDCPTWFRFLEDVTQGEAGYARFLQQWCGYSLTGDTREHALCFAFGAGGNGKSVFLNALAGVLGDYATTAAMDSFTAARGERHPTDLAMLRGARLVTASETEEGRAWAEARIKAMTGGDLISARFMRQDNFTFRPAFKLMIVGNHKPTLRNVDEAARRRFNLLPFTYKPAAPDRELEGKLKAEWPAVLRWMIEGCLDWQAQGLVRPAIVTEATETYFEDQDLLAQWLDEECDCEPGNLHKMETTADLFASWSDYAKKAGEAPGNSKSFKETMSRKGFTYKRVARSRLYLGIRLRLALRGEE